MTRILGIDPGTHITGYGLVKKSGSEFIHIDNGCIIAKRAHAIPDRLNEIYEGLRAALEKYKPDVVAIEEAFFAKNPASALRIGEGRGVAILAATQCGLPVYEYSTREVKQAITGFGQATKEQVQQMIKRILKLPEVAQVDASDALAVAICHLQSFRLKDIRAGAKS